MALTVGELMSDPESSRLDLTQVLDRFPDQAALIERLAVENETFRGVCEDLALARTTLARLSGREDKERHAAVISDYTFLVAELERDVAAALRNAHGIR